MIISCITDRLGNQLFQYSAAKSLAVKNNTNVKIDNHYYNLNAINNGDKYKLTHFNIPEIYASPEELRNYTWPNDRLYYRVLRNIFPKKTYFEKSFEYDKYFFSLGANIYLRGFWQSYKYFENIEDSIRQELTFKNIILPEEDEFAKRIMMSESVCLSVRRGDHISNKNTGKTFGQCSIDYYHKGLNIIASRKENINIFVFSDDIDWCINNLSFKFPTFFVKHTADDQSDIYDLQLITFCKNFVIPVSTFHWWGAWLSSNKDKIVVAPKVWLNDSRINTNDLCPIDWIRI